MPSRKDNTELSMLNGTFRKKRPPESEGYGGTFVYCSVVGLVAVGGRGCFKHPPLSLVREVCHENDLVAPVAIVASRDDGADTPGIGSFIDVYFPSKQPKPEIRRVAMIVQGMCFPAGQQNGNSLLY